MVKFLSVALFFMIPASAFAQDVDLNSTDSIITALVEAAQTSQWLVLAGLATTLIVLVLRKTGALKAVPAKAMPWVASAVAIVSAIATSLATGVALMEAVTQGVLVGAASSGFWELLFKHQTKKPVEPVAPAE